MVISVVKSCISTSVVKKSLAALSIHNRELIYAMPGVCLLVRGTHCLLRNYDEKLRVYFHEISGIGRLHVRLITRSHF